MEGSLKIYVNSQQQLRIDPGYYPCRRRYSWANFEKVVHKNPFALNFPFIQSLKHFTEITKAWMSMHCMDSLNKFADVPKNAIQMYCKVLRLLLICFDKFGDAKMQNMAHYKFNFGDQKLAWDFNIGPLPQQIYGLYGRVRFLLSFHMTTFEEMMQIGFIDGYLLSCFNPLAAYKQRYIATRLEKVQNPIVQLGY